MQPAIAKLLIQQQKQGCKVKVGLIPSTLQMQSYFFVKKQTNRATNLALDTLLPVLRRVHAEIVRNIAAEVGRG